MERAAAADKCRPRTIRKLEDKQERARLARVFEQGITSPVGCVLPLRRQWWLAEPKWESGEWAVRSEEMFLIPGDSPMGLRLPLESLLWYSGAKTEMLGYAVDPTAARGSAAGVRCDPRAASCAKRGMGSISGSRCWSVPIGTKASPGSGGRGSNGGQAGGNGMPNEWYADSARNLNRSMDASNVVRTALCVEPRNGVIARVHAAAGSCWKTILSW